MVGSRLMVEMDGHTDWVLCPRCGGRGREAAPPEGDTRGSFSSWRTCPRCLGRMYVRPGRASVEVDGDSLVVYAEQHEREGTMVKVRVPLSKVRAALRGKEDTR